nr:NBS-containing resistance-like protein [Tanacetum cinerariifolium]
MLKLLPAFPNLDNVASTSVDAAGTCDKQMVLNRAWVFVIWGEGIWNSSLFKRFCHTYKVQHHLEAPPITATSVYDPLHELNDSLVVMWMYSTISPKLVEMVVDDDTSAHDCLVNLDSPVKDSSLVTYAVNGIRSKYPDAGRVIRLREIAPICELRSMMLLEESDMSHQSVSQSILHNTSSSPTMLADSTTPTHKANTMSTSGFDVCQNSQRGSCTYGAYCKFVHGANDQRPRPSATNSTTQGRMPPTSSNRAPQNASNVASKPFVPNTNQNLGQQCVAQTPPPVYSDYQTRRLLLRCDSTGDLYPVTQQLYTTITFSLLALIPTTWHRRLGHPIEDVLRRLESSRFISCNKTKLSVLCHACQLVWIILSQTKFAAKILERAHMQHCNPCKTPVDIESKLCSDGDPVSDPTLCRSLADVDWAGCPVTHRSTSGYCVFLGDNLLSWSAKWQVTLSRSSAEAEYRGVANVVIDAAWIRNLLLELHAPLTTATLVYCDSVSAVYLSTNLVQHQRTKHIEIDIYFVRDYVASGQVRVLHVPSRFQYADIFPKGLPTALFLEFRSSLNVRRPPVTTAREYQRDMLLRPMAFMFGLP